MNRMVVTGLVWMLLGAGQAAGQAITGIVRDTGGKPLAQAQVVVLPGGYEAMTDTDGRFQLRRLSAGTYRVQVALIGYSPVVQEIRVGPSIPSLEMTMRASPLTLGGIQVTATGVARDPSQITQSTAQLSGRALEREMSGTVAQTLRYQPGIAVRSNGPAASMPVMRGLTGDRVLMLQDGQRSADLSGSADDHGVTIDPLTAQRVEVVRGPATLLYGNNALGGVVNVISGDVSGGVPVRVQGAVSAQTESAYPGGALSARIVAPLGETWSVNARGGFRVASDMRIPDDPALGGSLDNTSTRSWNGSVALSHAVERWSGSVALRAYDFRYGLPHAPDAAPVDIRGDRMEVAGRGEVATHRALFPTVRIDFTGQRYGHDEIDADDVVQQRFELNTQTLNMRVQQGAFGAFRDGAWGVSALLKDYNATGPAALTPAAQSRAFGIFGFQELGLWRDASLQFGARLDQYGIMSFDSDKFGDAVDRDFTAFSGSAGVRVPLTTGLSASMTAARSFRAPTVEELFSAAAHAGTGAVEYGTPTLREERGRSFEIVLQLRKDRINGQVAAYDSRVDDYIQMQFQGDTVLYGTTMPVRRYMQAPATLRGVEGSLEVAVSEHLLLAARGDWLHASQSDGVPLSYMPPARVGAAVRWDTGTFSVGGDAHHELAQGRVGPAGESPTDAHTILRIDSGLRLRSAQRVHSITLSIDNLTNSLHREATSRIRDYAPSAGRNVALGYRVHF